MDMPALSRTAKLVAVAIAAGVVVWLVVRTMNWQPRREEEHSRKQDGGATGDVSTAKPRDWDRLAPYVSEAEPDWKLERSESGEIAPLGTPVRARTWYWRSRSGRLSVSVCEVDVSTARRIFDKEAMSVAAGPESSSRDDTGDTAAFRSPTESTMMILARRGDVFYQVNGEKEDVQRLHGHVSAFVGERK